MTRIPRTALLASLLAFPLFACAPGATEQPPSIGAAARPGGAVVSPAAPVGTAGSFAILAGTAVTCTDATILGNVGVSPGTSITQTSCPVTGAISAGDGVAAQAMADFLVGYQAVAALPCDQTLTTLDGQTLAPGVYCFDAAVTSTGGVLTLAGPATGSWTFKVGTLGTGALTGTNFSVTTPSGAPPPCGGVTWWAAEAVTMTDSQLAGTILAGGAITLTRGTFTGNAYSMAAVTVTGNAVTGCSSATAPPTCTGTSTDGEDCQCQGDGDDDGDHDGDDDGDHGRDDDGDHGGDHDGGDVAGRSGDSKDHRCGGDRDDRGGHGRKGNQGR